MLLQHPPTIREMRLPQRPAMEAGRGWVDVVRCGRRSVVTSACAASPLKLLTPNTGSGAAWIFTSNYGGGLVGGDSISLDVSAGAGTQCLLSTQASTKVYRSGGEPCSQDLHVRIADDAIVVSAPDPIVCYKDAIFEQRQQFDLATNAGLIMIDWLTSGRRALGERWAFSHYQSQTDVTVDGRRVFHDAILLNPADGAIDGPMRMGPCDCFATILLVGGRLRAAIEMLRVGLNGTPEVIYSATAIPDGLILRAAGSGSEAVGRWFRSRLGFIADLVGQDPWMRKS